MENDLISVIVPIYNVEKYLKRCVDSIANQSYTNLEIILVDDGSFDYCPSICDDYAKKDIRIKVIHREHGGPSDARNSGLEIATGEYIVFIDSDDWIHCDMINILYEILIKENADIVECKSVKTNGPVNDINDNENTNIISFTTEEAISALIDEKLLKQTVWNKIYKREILDGILFEKGKYHEDDFYTYQVFGNSKKVVLCDRVLYYYFQRNDSIMGEAFSIKRIAAIEGKYNRYIYVKSRFPKLTYKAHKAAFFIALYYGQKALKCKDKDVKSKSISCIKEYVSDMMNDSEVVKMYGGKDKIWITISKFSVTLCCFIRNMFGIGVN